jgi:uncharacterized repeat protein (TIGR03803 family)
MKNILVLSDERFTRLSAKLRPTLALAAAIVLPVVLPPPLARAQTETVLHTFDGCKSCAYGGGHALLLKGSHLYGVADGPSDSDAFSLNIPAGGQATFKRLYAFPGGVGGNAGPTSPLISDAHGNLYGALKDGGAYEDGAVFELTPPAKGQTGWTEQLIYSFDAFSDQSGTVENGLAMDSSGAIYGATEYGPGGGALCGGIFKLTPATGGGEWTKTWLHIFSNSGSDGCQPRGNLLLDASGTIYGATQFGGGYFEGTVYTLAPPAAGQSAWTFTTIYQFTGGADGAQPNSGLIGGTGNLWGTTTSGGSGTECLNTEYGCGTVFELAQQTPGDPAYTLTTWHEFGIGTDGFFPRAGLYMDANGTFWGTTEQGGAPGLGSIYMLEPIRATYDYSLVYAFQGILAGDGANPGCALIEDASGALYGTTPAGSGEGAGVIFKLVP